MGHVRRTCGQVWITMDICGVLLDNLGAGAESARKQENPRPETRKPATWAGLMSGRAGMDLD